MTFKSFRQFTEESTKEIVVSFGRFNPPTKGHEENIEAVAKLAKGKPFRIYASQSEDPKKNPLGYEEKIKFMRKMFPQYGRNIILDRSAKNILTIASNVYNEGYTRFTLAVGSDRVEEFKKLLGKYNGAKSTHGYYKFPDGINIVSTGKRDPDVDARTGTATFAVSASKMRSAAAENDLEMFAAGLPKTFGDAKGLFNAVRKGMGLNESYNFRKHIQFESVGDIREKYIKGEVFNVGDVVVHNTTKHAYTISERCTNYVTVLDESNNTLKFFIHDLTESSKYYSGLSKSTSSKRKSHFEKNSKKDDNDDSAYELAPGDATAKTKPSQYTKAYAKQFGEESSPVEKALRNKSEKSGIAYSILKDVYDRGHAAWRTGHRPGTTPEQWGLARVNSFIVGGKTRTTADADLWKKV